MCPYCEIKKNAKIKTVYASLQPTDGVCKCGAFIDRGQHTVKINGYADIYNGAISLLDDMVTHFNNILEYCDIDLKDYFNQDVEIQFYTSEIIERLFLPYVGGTTKSNFANALDIEEDEHTWIVSKDNAEVE